MEITRASVLQWLEEHRRSQKWLSGQCGVSDQAVSNWLRESNHRPISAAAQITIRRLMEEDAARHQAAPLQNLVLEFEDDQFGKIERAALHSGKTVREWSKEVLNGVVDMDVEDFVAEFFPDRVARFQPAAEPAAIYELRFLGAVAAGQPVIAPLDEVLPSAKRYPSDYFVVEINGGSAEPEFPDGSRWVVRPVETGTPKQGVPCIVSDEYGSYLKRWNRKRGVFESINPSFDDVLPGESAKLQGYPVELLQ